MSTKPAKTSSTQDIVAIQDIRDSIIVLKNGSLRSIVEVGSINFELKSSDEQQAIVAGFQDFLNSIDFSLQICISSRKLNISNYIKSVEGIMETLTNELLQVQAKEYMRFITGLSELSNIMTKKFYIVVPYYLTEAPTSQGGLFSKIKSAFSPASTARNLSDEELEKYRSQIEQRISVIMAGVSRLGVSTRVIAGDELINLFYSFYNPGHHM